MTEEPLGSLGELLRGALAPEPGREAEMIFRLECRIDAEQAPVPAVYAPAPAGSPLPAGYAQAWECFTRVMTRLSFVPPVAATTA